MQTTQSSFAKTVSPDSPRQASIKARTILKSTSNSKTQITPLTLLLTNGKMIFLGLWGTRMGNASGGCSQRLTIEWIRKRRLMRATLRWLASPSFTGVIAITTQTKILAYSPPGTQSLFFTRLLNSQQTRRFICEVLTDTCKDIVDQSNAASCEQDLEGLAPTTEPLDNVEGNSTGCRALHAVLALTSPEQHCPHVSLTELEDPKGRIKCQYSTNSLPSDLFDSSDFEAYNRFARRKGFDPEVGHNCC